MDGRRGPWQPILHGALAEQAWEAIDAIALDLASDPFPAPNRSDLPPERMIRYASLGLGRVGPALFFAYLARARATANADERSQTLLAEAVMSATGYETDL